MEPVVGLVAVFLIFGGGKILTTWIESRAEIDRIKAQNGSHRGGVSNEEVLQALQDLRKEVAELRETTTRFDMSFDAAISTLEQRVDRIDENQYHTRPTNTIKEPLTLRRG